MRDSPGLSRLFEGLDPLPALYRELGRTLEPSGDVRDDASPDLARIRRSTRALRERLSRRLETIVRSLGIPESFVTLRDGRYAIAVPASHRKQVPGVALGYSGSGLSVFVEPREASEANSQLADLGLDELREVDRVLRDLTGRARRDREALVVDLDRLARLDAAQAVAAWAAETGGALPELTEERRRELVKHVRKLAEEYRVSLRNHRRDAIDLLKTAEKDKEITEDDLRKAQEKVQDMTKEHIEKLDKVLEAKEAEIMEV